MKQWISRRTISSMMQITQTEKIRVIMKFRRYSIRSINKTRQKIHLKSINKLEIFQIMKMLIISNLKGNTKTWVLKAKFTMMRISRLKLLQNNLRNKISIKIRNLILEIRLKKIIRSRNSRNLKNTWRKRELIRIKIINRKESPNMMNNSRISISNTIKIISRLMNIKRRLN